MASFSSPRPAARRLTVALLASSAIGVTAASAQDASTPASTPSGAIAAADIIVTATKRSERLQNVPISIQALSTATLEQHQVQNFDDYQKLLPSVSSQSFGPGQSQIYFRGITSGGDGLHIGSRPATGVYLDEIPLTTIANNVDVHVYDIARVEALSGPQGTLYGASSLSGTLRIITNQPDTTKFSGGIDADINKFGKGQAGGTGEGFLNFPLSERAAIRLVGFYEHDGGYIDNTFKQRDFDVNQDGTTDLTVDNGKYVKKNFNDADSYGGRAALKYDIDDNWTVTPAIVAQKTKTHGNFLYDPRAGDLKVHDFIGDYNDDRWYQASLTIKGKISDWDVTYAGGYFGRKVDNVTDYSYYTVDYSVPIYYAYIPLATGGFLDPSQQQLLRDKYAKQSHELRVSSPADKRLRLTAGLFYNRQTDTVRADYTIAGVGTANVAPGASYPNPFPGFGDDIFLTRAKRIDKDAAMFGEASFDILPNLTLLGGIRGFITKTSVRGFSGLSSQLPGICLTDTSGAVINEQGLPCLSIDKRQSESGETHKANLTWKVTPDKLVYFTYSTGFRPGGINRRAGVVPFKSDTLDNLEIGFKTQWFDRRLTVNGAIFRDTWKKVQFGLSPLGSNGVTNTYNAGDARIKGIEGEATLRLGGLTLSGSGTYVDGKLITDFCDFDAAGNSVCTPGVPPAAPKGTRLPVQPRFKGNATARYDAKLGAIDAFLQGTVNHQSSANSFLLASDLQNIGATRPFTTFDFSVGGTSGNLSAQLYIQNAFDKRGELSRNIACGASQYCGADYRVLPVKPQLFGVRVGEKF